MTLMDAEQVPSHHAAPPKQANELASSGNSPRESAASRPPGATLGEALDFIRQRMLAHLRERESQTQSSEPEATRAPLEPQHSIDAIPMPRSLELLERGFGLRRFESLALLTCAGIELESDFSDLCGQIHGNASEGFPTFGLLASVFHEADWNALLPNAPLRRWELCEFDSDARPLTRVPLRVDERILHHLMGHAYLDARLEGALTPMPLGELPPSHLELAGRAASQLISAGQSGALPLIRAEGADGPDGSAIIAALCHRCGADAYRLCVDDIPERALDRARLACRWNREWILSGRAIFVDRQGRLASECQSAERFIDALQGIVVTNIAGGWGRARPAIYMQVDSPTLPERRVMWDRALDQQGVDVDSDVVDRVSCHFRLDWSEIRTAALRYGVAAAEARPLSEASPLADDAGAAELWSACCEIAHPRVDNLLQHIEPSAAWEDLILPDRQKAMLRDLVREVRQRATVHGRWGFARKHARGLGVAAVFLGPSGTGKTLAAEVIAHSLELDLFRVDLSSVVSKYIGETAKNLQRVFDAAEHGGAVLLFDEADALFGKRSEVKDSHDRYANIEVGYLLQRMESYCGVSILTTNLKESMDVAFLRRLRRIVRFPFPEEAQREQIWRRVFPADTPTKDVNYGRLANLRMSGGSIYNIAIGACFIAAEGNSPVCMSHLLESARAEYAKLDLTLSERETRGWM